MATEKRPIEDYLNTIYPVTVYPDPKGGFVAEIEDLPGCITEGETLDEVFKRIEDVRKAWIEVQYEEGEEIPTPRTEEEYSGKFILRLPKGLHRKLAEQAKIEGTSLNQYVETLLASKATMKDVKHQLDSITELVQHAIVPYQPRYIFIREPEIQQPMMIADAVRP